MRKIATVCWLAWGIGTSISYAGEYSMKAIEETESGFLRELATIRKSETIAETNKKRYLASIGSVDTASLATLNESSNSYDPRLYLSLKKVENPLHNFGYDAKSYISLKQILLPTAENYAKTYLSLKSLRNPVEHRVEIRINKHTQTMDVVVDDVELYRWRVSTARRGYITPKGRYRPYTLERMHYSKKYHHSPMPWSIFFKGGYAIHGTYSTRRLGRPASHGCVRLHPKNAKTLYGIIRRHGMKNTKIIIN
jgi:lipoprotein-anchoring transpeptidase ErfK/SrfK